MKACNDTMEYIDMNACTPCPPGWSCDGVDKSCVSDDYEPHYIDDAG